MLSLAEAQSRLLSWVPKVRPERLSLAASVGRTLAEDLVAANPWPLFDYSAMDGYAVGGLAAFPDAGPCTLPVEGESRAGAPVLALAAGTVMRIYTGAPVPVGTETVVMQEDVERDGAHATFRQRPQPGKHIRRRGEDLAAGSVAIARGTRLGPAHVSLAAMLDVPTLAVAVLPRVTIVPTGDELRAPGEAGAPGTIPESNAVAIAAMAARTGAQVAVAASARDDATGLEADLARALATSDVVVTIGGVSVGDHDLVRPTLARLGAKLEVYKVAIKPGKPLTVGVLEKAGGPPVIILGLPGNPVSALVTFALFGLPLLRAFQGQRDPLPRGLPAELAANVKHAPGRLELVRATVDRSGPRLRVSPVAAQASGALFGLAHADALLEVPLDAGDLGAGADVVVHLFAELFS